MDNIWGSDPADIQLINKCNPRFRFLLCGVVIKKVLQLLRPFK